MSFIVRTTAVKSPETQRSLDALIECLKSNIGRVNRDHGESLLNSSTIRHYTALANTTYSSASYPPTTDVRTVFLDVCESLKLLNVCESSKLNTLYRTLTFKGQNLGFLNEIKFLYSL